ncbi:uncharacterized protein [Parasteatoda tepidariorum]|uniref:uncharacterized protein isoform X2 n=1 Tax=Parasteatoda tepidariorum TaxID=114398 RepID=UPI001C728743|nr:uncharacterized protein LOC122269302 isoform X2 [Parasteatoda tepidariorum]
MSITQSFSILTAITGTKFIEMSQIIHLIFCLMVGVLRNLCITVGVLAASIWTFGIHFGPGVGVDGSLSLLQLGSLLGGIGKFNSFDQGNILHDLGQMNAPNSNEQKFHLPDLKKIIENFSHPIKQELKLGNMNGKKKIIV